MRLPAFIEPYKKRILIGTVAAVVVIFVVVVLAGIGIFLCLMSQDNHVRPPSYEYIATVRGLDNFSTADGTARIMLPVPMYNGRAAVPFDKTLFEGFSGIPLLWGWFGPYGAVDVNIQGYGVHGTKSFCVTDSGYGRMIEARIVKTDYFEVSQYSPYYPSRENDTPDRYGLYTVRRAVPAFDDYTMRIETVISPAFSNETNATLRGLSAQPLYPDAGDIPTLYTLAVGDNLSGYTSYIYIDEGLKPACAGNYTIDIDASFVVSAAYRPYYMEPGDNHLFFIHESVPAGVTGFVPIRIQYDGRYNGSALAARLHYFRVEMLPEIDRPV